MSQEKQELVMYTTTWCGDCQITKQVLARLKIPFKEINIEQVPEAAEYVMKVNNGRRSVPTLVVGDDAESLSNFSRVRLEAFLARNNLLA